MPSCASAILWLLAALRRAVATRALGERVHAAAGGTVQAPTGLVLAFLASVVVGVVSGQQPEPLRLAGRLVVDTVRSPALEGNLLGDPAAQQVAIYLPPAYDRSTNRRFPAVYLLPPGDGSPTTWTRAWPGLFGARAGVAVLDSAMAAGAKEIIFVMPNGRNRYHASFFINSPVTGGWEDFVARDVVAHVDATYRTLPAAESRGIAGHSMGGNAATLLAMRYPELFGAVYSLSACCLAGLLEGLPGVWQRLLSFESRDELEAAFRAGDFLAMMLMAKAAAITPNPRRPPFFADLPYQLVDGALRPVEPAFSTWLAARPIAQIEAHEEALRRLRGLRLDYGNGENELLIIAHRSFSDTLAARGIPHSLEVYQGNHHNRIMERLASRVLPFFAEVLAF